MGFSYRVRVVASENDGYFFFLGGGGGPILSLVIFRGMQGGSRYLW